MAFPQGLKAHLQSGATTICRAWAVRRGDGVLLGFTDHDCALVFDGITFQPGSGMTASALAQSTGLAVDNAEAVGALSSDAICEADISAGRFDGAEVRIWLVNCTNPAERVLQFRGHIGDITRGEGAFTAELRGLAEAFGRAASVVYQTGCGATVGDARCKVDLTAPGYSVELGAETVSDARVFSFVDLGSFADRLFEKGLLRVLDGPAAGLAGVIKNDRLLTGGARQVELWQALRATVGVGDTIRLEAGCDRRFETCRLKFNNALNFRGFPHIPGEDWLTSYPQRAGLNDGASMWK
ncbi:DUF2163 domain-containing protein [Phaeovulum sp.]|uniref:DUF2163 domain-containing protein n=1 Tax=Phaeovulum sp. TaxID=2934796 RepID=UPI0035649390